MGDVSSSFWPELRGGGDSQHASGSGSNTPKPLARMAPPHKPPLLVAAELPKYPWKKLKRLRTKIPPLRKKQHKPSPSLSPEGGDSQPQPQADVASPLFSAEGDSPPQLQGDIAGALLDHIHATVSSAFILAYAAQRQNPQPVVPPHIQELLDQFVNRLAKEVGVETI